MWGLSRIPTELRATVTSLHVVPRLEEMDNPMPNPSMMDPTRKRPERSTATVGSPSDLEETGSPDGFIQVRPPSKDHPTWTSLGRPPGASELLPQRRMLGSVGWTAIE